jgi:hypothetical protein
MLNSLKGLIGKDDKKKENTINDSNQTFAGLNKNQMQNQINNAGQNVKLSQPKITETIQQALEISKPKVANNPSFSTTITSSFDLLQELATFYSEGESQPVIDRLRKYLNDNKGNVEHRFWYMLIDCYQVTDQRGEFDKVALSFAHKFGTSPPSWFEKEQEKKKGGLVGKNILILEPIFKQEHTVKFKDFFKSAKEEKFCRINVSSCKFEQSEISAIQNLHKLFTDLRKYRTLSILMGDNNLVTFCKNYINPNVTNKTLSQIFVNNEQICWLLYLEVLQWKGKQEEFENIALEYAMKFEISPPGWENEGVMSISTQHSEVVENDESHIQLDSILTVNNIETLIEYIKKDFEDKSESIINLASVQRIDFSGAGSISHFLQEILLLDKNKNKKVIFKYPNEMILILLEMLGVTEFVEIIPRKR